MASGLRGETLLHRGLELLLPLALLLLVAPVDTAYSQQQGVKRRCSHLLVAAPADPAKLRAARARRRRRAASRGGHFRRPLRSYMLSTPTLGREGGTGQCV